MSTRLPFGTGCVASVALLASGGMAQHLKRTAPVAGLVKDAGVYHVATGTWTRASPESAAFGPKTLYDNGVNTGYFGLHEENEIWWAAARLPGASDPSLPGSTHDEYVIDGCQIAYCDNQGPAGVGLTVKVYEQLASCANPALFPASAEFTLTGLPGSYGGGLFCWIVTLDLVGTSLVTTVRAEGGDGFDSFLDLDTGGMSFSMTSTSGGYAGPLLNGDPRNFPYGDGTYYQNPDLPGTGLGIQDQFYLVDTRGILTNGCYWFGGYRSRNPFTAWWFQLFGEGVDDAQCPRVCQPGVSSTGEARITAELTDPTTLHLLAEPLPDQPGLFFHGETSIRVPFGGGFLCTGGSIVRLLPPVVPAGGRAELELDVTGLAGRRYFQYWFRDPAAGGAGFNLTDAVCCDLGS